MFKVNSFIQNKLIGLPESGLGFQLVEGLRRDNTKKEFVILNATLAEPTYGRNYRQLFKDVSLEGMRAIYKFSEASNEIVDVKLIKEERLYKFAEKSIIFGSKGAADSKEESTHGGEYFIRFSPYEDDKRIDRIRMCLLPGSYATTFEDANYCLVNNIDPRDRYAIPAEDKIKYAAHIKPEEGTPIKRGIVDPAYGRPGGGIEVLFEQGTTDNTVLKVEAL